METENALESFAGTPRFRIVDRLIGVIDSRKIVLRLGDSVRVRWGDDEHCYADVDAIVEVSAQDMKKLFIVPVWYQKDSGRSDTAWITAYRHSNIYDERVFWIPIESVRESVWIVHDCQRTTYENTATRKKRRAGTGLCLTEWRCDNPAHVEVCQCQGGYYEESHQHKLKQDRFKIYGSSQGFWPEY